MQRLMVAYVGTTYGDIIMGSILCIPYDDRVRVYSFYKSLVGIDPCLYTVLDAWFCCSLRHR